VERNDDYALIISLDFVDSSVFVEAYTAIPSTHLSTLSHIYLSACDFPDTESSTFCNTIYTPAIREHLSVSLLPLSSPTLPLSICIPHPYLCAISKDYTYSWWLPGPMVQQLSRSQLTNSCRLPTSHSAHTLATSDKPQMHWDRSTWHYSTFCHHMDNHIWEAWY
jgi:hypothetical protein